MTKRVSIVDVAGHAGVSVSTVSLVMNNRPNVSQETAEAVWKSAKVLGYSPGGGSGKKRGPKPGPRRAVRIPHILMLLSGHPAAYFRSDVFSALLHGVQDGLKGSDAVLILSHCDGSKEACDVLRRSRQDGVLLVGCAEDTGLCNALKRIPCVQALGTLPTDGIWDHVTYNVAAVSRLAAQWLLERGRRSCAMVSVDHLHPEEMGAVFGAEVVRQGGKFSNLCTEDVVSFDGIFPSLNPGRLMSLFAQTVDAQVASTGVFLSSELLAGAFYRFCGERSLRPGRDLDVVCASLRGPSLLAAHPSPAIVNIHPEQVGRQAVEQILWRIEHRNEPHETRLISPSLIGPDGR